MTLPSRLLRALALAPDVIRGIETELGPHVAQAKRDAALSILHASIDVTTGVQECAIRNEELFMAKLGAVVDAIVDVLDETDWRKG